MSISTQMTGEELAQLPRGSARYELVRGELRTISPAGANHGFVAMLIGSHLTQFVRKYKLGRVFAGETGFHIESEPDTVRAPDVSFISLARLPKIPAGPAFLKMAPDLAIEVLSPSDSLAKLEQKIEQWLETGTEAAVIVDPVRRTATVHRAGSAAVELTESESLEVPTVVPGWSMPLHEMFDDV